MNNLWLLPAHLRKMQERRAPEPLHVGRCIPAIQGRRVGEWHEQDRSASAGRDRVRALRTDLAVDMVLNRFATADSADLGMLDVFGFDTATPQLMSDFARGAL